MKIHLKLAVLSLAAAIMSGCATQAPPYQPSIDNVQVLQSSKARAVSLGGIAVTPDAVGATDIKLRAVTMSSPVGGSFAAYLADALKQELEMAKLLDPKSPVQLSGTLLSSDVDTAMGTASGYAEARFVVKKDGQVRFDKVKRGEHRWESSFVGAVAIPAAQMNYPVVLQHLLSSLYGDADFQNALNP